MSIPGVALPTLFVSHGSPMFAVEPGTTGPVLGAYAQSQLSGKALRGVLVMSPHWMAAEPVVMGHPKPDTWHDFGGFPEVLYTLDYPAPGAPDLALRVQDLLADAGINAPIDPHRPRDHGAWVPMMHLLPEARVPVIQIALPTHASPPVLYAMGQALCGLKHEGVLVVGSGSMTHNLREFFTEPAPQNSPPEPYVTAFARWVEQALVTQDRDSLFDYRQRAPQAARAHPTDEHWRTLYFALGAAQWGTARAPSVHHLSREVMHRWLAMDAVAFHAPV
jgi:4,5-DOPA dioxygenase extradiol